MIRGMGTIIDVTSILVGGGVGLVLGEKVNRKLRAALTDVLGLMALSTGVMMIMKESELVILLLSLVLGVMAGEKMQLGGRLKKVMGKLAKTRQKNGLSQAFLLASLLSLVGPLAILGPIEEGVGKGINLLMFKTGLDGVATVMLTSVMGKGVILSAVPVLVFQGGLTLLAGKVGYLISEAMINSLSGLGGVMLLALGLDLLKIKKIEVVNLLPGFLAVPVVTLLLSLIGGR